MFSAASNAHIVILTGAGISKESGIDTFRDGDGLWSKHNIEDVCTPEGFHRNPDLVHGFYNSRRKELLNQSIAPNSAHIALAELEDKWSGKVTLITQNIDNLHERGGHKNVLHMHGSLTRLRCRICTVSFEAAGDTSIQSGCPSCAAIGYVRPDIVWFGEMPYHMDDIYRALEDADLFVAIGTSGTVYPAAGFASLAAGHGAQLIEINLEPSLQATYFTHGLYGPATEQVPHFVNQLLKDQKL